MCWNMMVAQWFKHFVCMCDFMYTFMSCASLWSCFLGQTHGGMSYGLHEKVQKLWVSYEALYLRRGQSQPDNVENPVGKARCF